MLLDETGSKPLPLMTTSSATAAEEGEKLSISGIWAKLKALNNNRRVVIFFIGNCLIFFQNYLTILSFVNIRFVKDYILKKRSDILKKRTYFVLWI